MQEIPWERTADGKVAWLDGEVPRYLLPILSLLKLSEAKMTEVGLISANFHDTPVSFVKRLTVYLDTRARSEFLGLYMSDEQRGPEEASEQVPTLCLRHAIWNKKGENERFQQAASMKEYVSNQQQLEARIVFLTPEMAPAISHLDEEAHSMVKQGVAVLATSRSNLSWESIDFGFHDILHVDISYVTHSFVSDELEAWVRQWYQCCTEVNYFGGILPDNGCRIGYPFSMMNTWKHFPEQSFQQWRESKHH